MTATACIAILASATSTASITPPSPESHRALSSWFVLGLPCILAFATLFSLVISWVPVRASPWLLAVGIALLAAWLSVHAWRAADPYRRVIHILGVEDLPAGSVVAYSCFDTLNEGRIELGAVTLPAAALEKLVAEHRPSPPKAVPGAVLDALGATAATAPLLLPCAEIPGFSIFVDLLNRRVYFVSTTDLRS